MPPIIHVLHMYTQYKNTDYRKFWALQNIVTVYSKISIGREKLERNCSTGPFTPLIGLDNFKSLGAIKVLMMTT